MKQKFYIFSLLIALALAFNLMPSVKAADAKDIREALEAELASLADSNTQNIANDTTSYLTNYEVEIENPNNPLVAIETSLGTITLELFPNEAPKSVTNFLELATGNKYFSDPISNEQVQRPFYDGLIFHRVIKGFMVQSGSPTGSSDGGPGYSFNDEINALSLGLDKMSIINDDGYPHPFLGINNQSSFQEKILIPLYKKMNITSQADIETNIDLIEARLENMTVKQSLEALGYQYTETVLSRKPLRGVIAMASQGPNMNGSQFFITLEDSDWLTGKHTVFGEVKSGLSVLDSIGNTSVDANHQPYRDLKIISIKLLKN